MNTRQMLIVLAVAATMSATAALAQTAAPADAPAGAPAVQGDKSAAKEKRHEEKFEEAKAKHLEHLKQKEACVQAATDRKSLQGCFPKEEERREWRKEHGGEKFGGRDHNRGGEPASGAASSPAPAAPAQ